MRAWVMLVLAVIIIVLVVVWWRSGGSETAKSAQEAITAPVDAINTDLQFKEKAGLEMRMITEHDELKQLDAMGTDDPTAVKAALDRVDQLEKDLADAKAHSSPSVDGLIRTTHWQETEDLATQLRAKLPAAAP